MNDEYEGQTPGGLPPLHNSDLAGIYENINTVATPVPIAAPVKTDDPGIQMVGGLPPWLQKPVAPSFPKVVQNKPPTGVTSGQIPGVYYPQPAANPAMTTATTPPIPNYAPPPVPAPIISNTLPSTPQPAIPQIAPVTAEAKPMKIREAGKSRLVPFTANLYYLVGVIYAVLAAGFMVLLFKYNLAVTSAQGINFYFLKDFPAAGLLPLTLILASTAYWWMGAFLHGGSRAAWTVGVLGGIGIPVLLGLVKNLLNQLGVAEVWETAVRTVMSTASGSGNGWQLILTAQQGLILPTVVLLASFKAYGNQETAGSDSRLKVALVTIFWVFITLGLLGTAYVIANKNDAGYKATAEQAGFRIYAPKAIPAKRTQISQYFVNHESGMLNGRTDFVQVNFDYSPIEQTRGKNSSQIILRQVDVPADFDSLSFAASLLGGTASPAGVLVQNATNNEAYTLNVPGKNGNLSVVTFKTVDNVLIFLSSATAGLNDLIMLANNLE